MEEQAKDRELLELAGKAAGVIGPYFENENPIHCGIWDGFGYWNPLRSDADALRLAVKLRITLYMDGNLVQAESIAGFQEEPYFNDECAAVRRVVTRAAASLAKEPTP